MKKIKQILMKFPEYYLIVLIILAGYTPPFTFNPMFVGLACIPILQIIFKNKISGLIIAILFLLANLFMLGALISELREFTEFNNSAKQLLVGGLSLWCFNMFAFSVMLYKYLKSDNEKSSINFRVQKA
jgi:hypothetical protein